MGTVPGSRVGSAARFSFLLLSLLCAVHPAAARVRAASPTADALSRAKKLYYDGDLTRALKEYKRALKFNPRSAAAWLNGAVVLEEFGKNKTAARWYRRAADLNPGPEVEAALGGCEWKIRHFDDARKAFDQALTADPKNSNALLGMARLSLSLDRPRQALGYLKRTAKADPFLDLVPFYKGEAYQRMRLRPREINAYRRAALSDSYFLEARERLGRAYLQAGLYQKAWSQFLQIQKLEPESSFWEKIARTIPRRAEGSPPISSRLYHWLMPLLATPLPANGEPLLRVGIGTDHMGRPLPRSRVFFYVTSPFELKTAKGKILARGAADQAWIASLEKSGRRTFLLISGPPRALVRSARPVLVEPDSGQAVVKLESPASPDQAGLAKVLRGTIEIAPVKKNLRLVDIIDLENYTQGVLASEMPIRSPAEALKAQAVLVRSEAVFLKDIWRRHKKQGYDLCDGEHCQVYGGVRSESPLARRIVQETRGEILFYKGKPAHGIYSANCGGHTQSSAELKGWGRLPYWEGIPDGGRPRIWPLSPWELRRWLSGHPDAFCKPSADVYPSHYRWTRSIDAAELGRKLSRRLKIGRLKSILPLKRSISGNVNSVLVAGTRRRMILRNELNIRRLLGLGSLRSTLFVLDTEYDARGRPERFIFHGGGWGHGVGLCQSGAMGRANAGQNYKQILKSYFPGTAVGQLDSWVHN